MRIEVTIEGTSPLLMNKFTDAAQQKASSGKSGTMVGDRGTPREQAQSKLYTNEAGEVGIPQPNLLRCFIDAGKFFKAGRTKVTTQKSSILPGIIDIHGVHIPLDDLDEAWYPDTRPVRIPATGGRILAHRPCFPKWRLSFEIELDTDEMSAAFFRDIVDAAGRKIGLGDFRPDCKGPFGRFVVVSWETESTES